MLRGSDPYKLMEYVPDQFYRLEENLDYFAGEPIADTMILPIIKDPTSTFSALKVGEIDVSARELTPELVEEFENTPGVKVVTGPGFTSTMVQFNVERESFDNVAFRQVVAGLIDYPQLVDTLNIGGYGNATVDTLVDQQAVTTDREQRGQLLGQIQTIIAEELPFITLFYQDRIFAYRPEVYDNWVFQVGEGIINKLSLIR